MKASNNYYQMNNTYSTYGAEYNKKAGSSNSKHVQTNKTLSEEFGELVQQKKEEFINKLKSGETQPTFQIGAITMTEEEWDKLLVKTDIAIDQIKEEQKEIRETNSEKAVTQDMITELLKDRNKSYEEKLDETDDDNADDESHGNKSETDSNVIVKADGSRVLEVTMKVGGTETTMCLEISKPTNLINDVNKSHEMSGETQPKI